MKAQFFEFYANHIWPLVQPFFQLSQRCQRCILNEKASPIINGLCTDCQTAEQVKFETSLEVSTAIKENFQLRINSLIDSKNRYDCIFLLSGGKDSAYVLYRLRNEFPKLKILTVTINNGFMSPIAIQCAEKTALKLRTDWLLHNSSIDKFHETIREAFLSLNGKGCYGVVDYADGSLLFECGKQLALDMKIPALIGGLSWVQVQRILGQDHFELNKISGVSEIFPLAVWRTNEQEIRKQVQAWDLMLPHSDSPLVSNSTLITTMAVLDVLNIGYSSFEPEFAQLIREGKTDRKSWLQIFQLLEFASKKGLLRKEVNQTLKQLDLKFEQLLVNKGASK